MNKNGNKKMLSLRRFSFQPLTVCRKFSVTLLERIKKGDLDDTNPYDILKDKS